MLLPGWVFANGTNNFHVIDTSSSGTAARYAPTRTSYAFARYCWRGMLLRARVVLSARYAARRHGVPALQGLRPRCARYRNGRPGRDVPKGTDKAGRGHVVPLAGATTRLANELRLPYHAGTRLRGCYALCGTELAYGATRGAVLRLRMVLCDVRVWCYAMCGTELAYGATAGGEKLRFGVDLSTA
eukprot:3941522-Rhodomonas_salina.6